MMCVLFGGVSEEHAFSVETMEAVWPRLAAIQDPGVALYMSMDRRLYLVDRPLAFCEQFLTSGAAAAVSGCPQVAVLLMSGRVVLTTVTTREDLAVIDSFFPLCLGGSGEDGSIQGLSDFAGVPCVGATTLGAAIAFDKPIAKDILSAHGIRSARYVVLRACTPLAAVSAALGEPPYVVKPRRQGSSIGVAFVGEPADLERAVAQARDLGEECVVEQFIDGTELHCYAMRVGGEIQVSRVSGTKSRGHIYSYEQKAHDPLSVQRFLQEDLPANVVHRVRDLTRRIYGLLDGKGLARIDYFLADGRDIWFNESNTVPTTLGPVTGANPWSDLGWSPTDMVAHLVANA